MQRPARLMSMGSVLLRLASVDEVGAPQPLRAAIVSPEFLGRTIGIAFGHAVTHVLLDSVLREGIAKAVLRQRRHSLYRVGHVLRRQGHQHLIVEYAAVAPLGETGDGQRGLAGLERAAPAVGARALT